MESASSSLASIKLTAKANLKNIFWMTKSTGNIAFVSINDWSKKEFILRWLSDIWIWAVYISWDKDALELPNVAWAEKINQNMLHWFDFFVYDNEDDDVDVVKFMSHWIVPIMPEKNTYSRILKEFNPMKFEWNGFFWKKDSPYCIFEKIVCYLENIKFPEDKRILQKNVANTF